MVRHATAPFANQFAGTDRFAVVRQLGMGGMGVVYEARDRDTDERVALKTLRDVDGEAILLLKQEFRTLANLHHPNLIRLGELVESRGDWFFTMELVEGLDLISYVREGAGGGVHNATVDHAKLRDALAQLVTGLGVLHDAGHVHRDVKPSNVLVTDGRVVLLDFGLATAHLDQDDLSWSDAAIVGTPAYMAPEQAASQHTGPEADFYAVGVIMYQALTGRFPLDGKALGILMEKQRVIPPAPSTLTEVPADLDSLCCDLLKIDPAQRPTRKDILRRLGTQRTSAPMAAARDSAPITPIPRRAFVGRAAELQQLRDAFAESDTGVPVTVLLEGESGLGKSALAEHFVRGLDARDVIVLRGRCYERESVPYKAVDGIVDSLSRFMARLPDKDAAALLPFHIGLLADVFPVLRNVRVIVEQPRVPHSPDPHEQRRQVFDTLRELLARLGARRPLVLLIDDLHWADDDSLAMLDAILQPPNAPCLFLLGTAWPRDADEPPLAFGPALRRMVLAPLAGSETAQLASALASTIRASVSERMVATIVRESGGHPMFVAELVRDAALRGDTTPTDDVRLDDILARRIEGLEPAERQLLELVAAAGRPLPLEIAGRALDLPPATLVPLVGYLQTANLVRATGRTRRDSIEPFHERTRRTVSERAIGRKAELHRRLALALEATDADTQPMLVAEHWERAGEPARATALYLRAAERASDAFAFEHAVRLYEKVRALDPAMAPALRAKLGDAYANAGRGREAADVYLALARETAIAVDARELERKAAYQLLRGGHIDDGLEVIERLLAGVKLDLPQTPRAALATLVWRRARVRLRGIKFKPRDPSEIKPADLARIDMVWAAAIGLSMTDWIRGAAFQALNLLLSLETGEAFRARRALLLEACHVAAAGDPAGRAEQLIAAAVGPDATRELDDPYLRGWVKFARGYSSYFRGGWRTAFELAEEADAIWSSSCVNVVWERDTVHALSQWAQVYLGSLKTLGETLPARLRAAEQAGNLYAVWALPASISVMHWIARDDVAGGRAAVAPISERWSLRGYQIQHWNEMASNALLDLYAGDVMGARRRVEQGWVPMSKSLLTKVQLVRFEVHELQTRTALAAALASTGSERERYLALADEHVKKLAKEDLPWMAAIASLRRAGIRAARGDRDGAIRELRAAVPACAKADLGLHAAAARVRLGELVGGDEGLALRDEGYGALVAETVVKPERVVALFAP